jgi:alginate O-acetyltransferase complex protein AlgI
LVFSSLLFLFRFLPVAMLLYFIVPPRLKNFTLLVLSLFFYAWGEPKYIWIMIVSILVDYTAGQGIRLAKDNQARRKFFLGFSLTVNLGMLLFFKYADFFIDNINAIAGLSLPHTGFTLPLGISFYTFQTMSYTIDVYRGKVEAESNIINFGAFVVLFPQLIAGPIVKYSDIAAELKNRRRWNPEQIQDGVRLFIMGLGSKVLIANNVGALWTQVEASSPSEISTALAWLGVLAFSLQIYFDFSGYSLMAIGLGRMLGFTFPQNFNYPYISRSITEFWRRWHMTLSSWFREYIYIPLGGSRVSTGRMYFNLFVVWACTGFWHGASWNFVLWGLFFFVILVIEKRYLLQFLEKHRIVSHAYVLLLLLLSWTLFAITDFSKLGEFFRQMFTPHAGSDWIYALRNYGVSIVLACFFATPVTKRIYDRYLVQRRMLTTVLLAGVLILSVAYLVDASYNPFLYFRF